MNAQQTWEDLERKIVVPVLRTSSQAEGERLAAALFDAGHRVIEVTFTTPGAIDIIATLTANDGLLVGAGTIMTEDQASQAVEAGAAFLVSAANPPFLLPFGRAHDLLAIPGAATPHEVWSAYDAGAIAVKVFPAARLGGAAFIKDLKGPFPNIPLLASGGITESDIETFRTAGCSVVCINAAALMK